MYGMMPGRLAAVIHRGVLRYLGFECADFAWSAEALEADRKGTEAELRMLAIEVQQCCACRSASSITNWQPFSALLLHPIRIRTSSYETWSSPFPASDAVTVTVELRRRPTAFKATCPKS